MNDELLYFLNGWVLQFVRCFGFFALMGWGQYLSSAGLKLIFILAVSLIFSDFVVAVAELSVAHIVSEFLIGLCIALPFLVLMEFLSGIGEVVDALRGQTIATQYSPLASGVESISSQLYRPFLWCLVLQMGLLERCLALIGDSLQVASVAHSHKLNILEFLNGVAPLVLDAAVSGLSIFLPFALLIISVDLLLVYIQSALPQANLVNEAFLLKTVLAGIALMILGQQGIYYDWLSSALDLIDDTYVLLVMR